MCAILREEGRTLAWLGASLGVQPSMLRQLVDGEHNIPFVHWIKVQRWVEAHQVPEPPKRHADGPGPEPQRMGPDARPVGDPRPPRARHPPKTNVILSREVAELHQRVAALEAKLTQGAEA